MNIKELVLKDIPNNLNDLEKARYVYLKLAEYLNFSTKYNNTTDYEMGLLYTSNIDSSNIKSNQVNCRFWVQIYSSILNEFGIENKIIGEGHQGILFKVDNIFWFADATAGRYTDLARIKYGDETTNFSVALKQNFEDPVNGINLLDERNHILESIDNKFEFYQNRKRKLLNIKERLNFIKDEPSLTVKCRILFKLLASLDGGYYESRDFLYTIEKCVLTEEQLSRVHVVALKRTNKDLEVDIIDVIYLYDNGYRYFIMSPGYPIKEVTKEDIPKLSLMGYGLDDKKIPNIDYPKKFELGKVSTKSFGYKLFKKIPDYLKVYDSNQTIARK